ncbi:MAG: hydrogenase expression/formation protein [Rubrivivax sp.]
MMNAPKPFPVPVVSMLGPGSHDDEAADFLPLPRDMATWQPPPLPEPEDLAAHAGCVQVLRQALQALRSADAAGAPQVVALDHLSDADRRLLNQVLGEGEVAAQVLGDDGLRVQESVFAGLWRVLHLRGGQVWRDTLEIGALPQGLLDAAAADAPRGRAVFADAPDGVMNAPALLAELDDRSRRWQPGTPAHVVNLTLLPLSAADSAHLDAMLPAGRVLILSRGYGNCRITNLRLAQAWRVTYFNSTDINILDTLEIGRVPEVACAAAEDLQDSAERLAEVLEWVSAA